MNGYAVYEKGVESPREDPPFDAINDWTSFNAIEKTITQSTYYGFIDNKTTQMEELRYIRQQDGSLALTDSSMVLLRLQKNGTFVDSLRTHYRRQGDKMVLLMQEVLK